MAAFPLIMASGAALSAVGAISQGQAAKAAHSYNAQLLERDATLALNQSGADAAMVARKAAQDQGSLVAGYGAAGVATDEGSPVDVLRMSVANAKLDEGTVLYKGRVKATGYYNSAALERTAGKTAQQQGALNAASYLLTGAGNTAYTMSRSTALTAMAQSQAEQDALQYY